ncbi:MAG: signal recognition particle-docking protein FtsY [Candidatus Firestonebacteria bacterium]|nr:signal recognition particle-docking protein FtsY [Candidatus Firestonebacteria bacterium]
MEKKSIWKKLKGALTKSRENIVSNLNKIISGKKIIDKQMLESLEEILIQADIGVKSTNKIIELIHEKTKKGIIKNPEEIKSVLQEEIYNLLKNNNEEVSIFDEDKKPFIIMVVGVNGTGKTTTIGKLSYYFHKVKGKKVLVGAADTFRAAAIEQLEIWCQRAGCDIVKQKHGSDAASVAYDTLQSANARGHEVVIIDTAGRLHTKTNLMEELKKIKRIINKINPLGPHKILLVIDANTGQNGLQQAHEFDKAVGIDGLILTKLDSTAKGGIVVSIKQSLNIPVYFIGLGENIEDLEQFDPEEFAKAIVE